MPAPLTKETLDRAVCMTPGCTHEDHDVLFLHGACHPQTATVASYKIGSGIVHVACAKCEKTIVDIAVQGLLGATGETPTSETPGDLGSLRAMLSIREGRIRMDFGKMLSWVTMTKEEAKGLAVELWKRAEKLPE